MIINNNKGNTELIKPLTEIQKPEGSFINFIAPFFVGAIMIIVEEINSYHYLINVMQ